MSRPIQQINNINVVGIRRGTVSCPSGTWQRKTGTGNPKDSPVCSGIDTELCGPDDVTVWANLTSTNDGTQVSFDGLVFCVPPGESIPDPLDPLEPPLEPIVTPPLEPISTLNPIHLIVGIFVVLVIIILIIALIANATRNKD